MEVCGHHAPAALTQGNNPGSHWGGGWVGPRVLLGGLGEYNNVLPLTGFEEARGFTRSQKRVKNAWKKSNNSPDTPT